MVTNRRSGVTAPDLTTIYLNEIGRHRLLPRREIEALARLVRRGQAAALGDPEACAAGYAERAVTIRQGKVAAAALVQANLRLVATIARRYRHKGVAFLDLVQEGNLGLLRAVQRFDPERGFAFSTYASWWIRAAMAAAVTRANHAGSTANGTDREESEASASLQVPTIVNMSAVEDLLVDRSPTPLDQAVAAGLPTAIARLLGVLEERERQVLSWHFGLGRHRPRTLADIARELGVSEERVRQIEATALAKLRRPGRRLDSARDLLTV